MGSKRKNDVPRYYSKEEAPYGVCAARGCGAPLLAPFDSGMSPRHPEPNPHRVSLKERERDEAPPVIDDREEPPADPGAGV